MQIVVPNLAEARQYLMDRWIRRLTVQISRRSLKVRKVKCHSRLQPDIRAANHTERKR